MVNRPERACFSGRFSQSYLTMSTTRYYSKDLPESPVYIMGHPMKFDILATQDTLLITELDKCVKKGVGGVATMSEADYNEAVKKKELSGNSPSSSNGQRRQVLSALHLQQNVQPVAGRQIKVLPGASQVTGRMPEPIEVPSPQSFGLPPLAKTTDVNKK